MSSDRLGRKLRVRLILETDESAPSPVLLIVLPLRSCCVLFWFLVLGLTDLIGLEWPFPRAGLEPATFPARDRSTLNYLGTSLTTAGRDLLLDVLKNIQKPN